jgi:hypothetical protein
MSNSVKDVVVNELHKPSRKHYKRRKVIVKGLNDLWQADLVEVIPYWKFNKGYKYLLVVINVFSKFLWIEPLKSKTAQDVTIAMRKVLKNVKNTPKNLQTDLGKEFFNKEFKKLMDEFNINHYNTFSNLKASVVERVNRTIKNLMWKKFSLRGNYKWIDILDEIVQKYNNTKHSTIKKKPKEVNESNESIILKSAFTHIKSVDPKPIKFKVDDFVRISKQREAFTKGYTPNWSNEIFQIYKIKYTNPTTYLIKDENNVEIQGGFYEHELQKVKYPDVYLVEKILRRKGNKVLVKWLGLDKTHNSWILKKDLL